MFEPLESRTLMSASMPHVTTAEFHYSDSGDTSDVTVPAKPTDLVGSAVGTGVTLNWTDNSSNETGFAVFRYAKGKLTRVGTADANSTTFTDTTAPAGNDYYIVRAFNDAGNSEGSNPVCVQIAEPVRAPRRLRSEAVSTTSIKLCWEGDSGATGGYVIERYGPTGWTPVGTAAPGVRKFTDTGLTARTKYYYHIVALGADGHTATSAPLIGKTKATDKGDTHK